ncbi:MAG: FtsX-like permease family protein [Candidatus Njordarchaeota archaeon]
MGSIFLGLKIAARRPSLWVGTLIGIILATTLVFGAFMATDYIGIGTVNKTLEDVRVDMRVIVYGANVDFLDNYSYYLQRIESIENITYVDVFARCFVPLILYKDNMSSGQIADELMYSTPIFFVNLDTNIEGIRNTSGSFDDGIGLGKQIAKMLDVDAGDNITIRSTDNSSSKNITIGTIVEFSGDYYDMIWWMDSGAADQYSAVPGVIYQKPELSISYDPNYAIIIPINNRSMFDDLVAGLMDSEEYEISFYYLVSIDRSKIIDPWDLDGSIRRVRYVESKIYMELQGIENGNVYVQDYVLTRLMMLSFTFSGAKFGFTIQLLPIVILGVLLAFITNWIMVNKRRREIGLLRVRGLSSRQILIIHIIEAIVIGAVGALIGLCVGYFFALYLTHQYATQFIYLIAPEEVLSVVVWSYILPCAIFGGILGLIAVMFPAQRVSNLSLEKSLAEYVEEVEAEVKISKKTIFLLIISTYGIIELIGGMQTLRVIFEVVRRGSVFLMLPLVFFILFYFFSIFVGPFLFPYAFGKMIAAYSHRMSGVFEKLARPISGGLSSIASRNFIRKKTRTYKVVLLIALTLAFGVYHTINRETNNYRVRINLEMSIGSDIRLAVSTPIYFMDDIAAAIDGIDGISDICYISRIYSNVGQDMMSMVLLNKSYFDISFVKDEYLDGLTKSSTKEKLDSADMAILSIYAKREQDYKIGDEFIFNINTESVSKILNFTVAGFIKFAPGLSDIFGMQSNLVAIAGYKVLDRIPASYLGSIYLSDILIKVKDGYNATKIAIEVQDALEEIGIGASAYVFDMALKTINEHWAYLYSNVFVDIMLVMSLVMAISGMTLTMVASILERRKEIALLRVRGASKKEIVGIIGGEALIITILGYFIGLIVSLAYSYGMLVSMNTIFYTFMGIYIEFPPGYALRIPIDLFIVLGVAFVLFIFSAILPLFFVFKEDISEELRIRH